MTADATRSGLRAERLVAGYGDAAVLDGVDLALPAGRVTAIVGPNGCGKSTLLRTLARLLRPRAGAVLLDGRDVHGQPTRDVARRLGLLPQGPSAPDGLTVAELVARGRFPHRGWLGRWSAEDAAHVERALARTGMGLLRDRPVDELSGGQRQRAWIAMALAQDTPTLLLDEPTTFLDLAHRLEVLELLGALNRAEGRTVVMVLHELADAARHADHVVAMRDGAVVAAGPPAEVVTADVVEAVFGVSCRVLTDPGTGTPIVVPDAGARARAGGSAAPAFALA
jgi:iron complex transport system ATP-binding protein